MTQEAAKHVLLTTIGAGKPGEITYREAEYHFEFALPKRGKFFSVLLCDALREVGKPIQKAVVLLTAEAKTHVNWLGTEGLEKLLKERGIEIITVDIPNGNNEQEIWEIFDAIGAHIPQDASVTLDITHGFRSLPLVMLLSCAYFNTSNRFALEAVYYGAYILGQPQAQAVDLTPMLTLFAWANAVKVFKDGGDLRQMAALLKGDKTSSRNMGGVKEELPTIAKQMRDLTEALELGRLRDIARPVREIRRLADKVRISAQRKAKPFVSQIDEVLAQLEHFQISMDEPDVRKWLIAQFRLIEWYTNNDYYMQATLLLDEWVISFAASQTPEFSTRNVKDIFEDKEIRKTTEDRLNEASKNNKELGKLVQLAAELSQTLDTLPDGVKELVGLTTFTVPRNPTTGLQGVWDSITQLRNTVAHLGHHRDERDAGKIKKKLDELLNKLRPLILPDSTPTDSAAPTE